MNVLSCVYNESQCLYRRFNTTIKRSTEVNYFDLPHVCFSGISQVWKMQGTRLGKHWKSLQEDAPSVLPLITKTKFKRHYDINRWFWKSNERGQTFTFSQDWKLYQRRRVLDLQAKDCLSRLERINITTNMHFSVRAIACLCSYLSLTEVCANGILLDHTDMLFLAKTFPRLRNGDIQLETDRTISTLWILPPRMTFWRVILNLFWRFYFFYWEIVMFWEPLEQNTRERTFIIVSRQVSDQ